MSRCIISRPPRGSQRDSTPIRADPLALPRLPAAGDAGAQAAAGPEISALARPLPARYRPDALISAAPNCNLAAVWANRLAGGHTKVLISERTAPSKMLTKSGSWRLRFLPALMHRTYQQADVIVAVSDALGDDLAAVANIPRRRIVTIYNPVVGPICRARARAGRSSLVRAGAPPVVLSAGRLSPQKDFPTLVQAFAALRGRLRGTAGDPRRCHGGRQDRAPPAGSHGVGRKPRCGGGHRLLGFMPNPYAYMARARVFVLSSAWEGFGNVLVEALACGCPVVSTDCPYGPREILAGGRYGRLTPVGDAEALADAMAETIAAVPDRALLRARAEDFTVGRSVDGYLAALFGADVSGWRTRARRPGSPCCCPTSPAAAWSGPRSAWPRGCLDARPRGRSGAVPRPRSAAGRSPEAARIVPLAAAPCSLGRLLMAAADPGGIPSWHARCCSRWRPPRSVQMLPPWRAISAVSGRRR